MHDRVRKLEIDRDFGEVIPLHAEFAGESGTGFVDGFIDTRKHGAEFKVVFTDHHQRRDDGGGCLYCRAFLGLYTRYGYQGQNDVYHSKPW